MTVDPLDAWLQAHAGDPRDIELGLDRVAAVHTDMGCPVLAGRVVTIGGTNGKGSSAAMLEAIYEAAGYRTGAYTSPHLHEYRERVRLRGEAVAEARMLSALEAVEAVRHGRPLTYFEFGTLAAFWLFAQQALDVVLLEVGLGGRLDAVNLIDADVALVTNVALDHQAWLGDDREKIGREKAGIFRPGRPAICGESAPPASLVRVADELGADLRLAGRDFHHQSRADAWEWSGRASERNALPLPSLRGSHQLNNAAAALAVLEALQADLPVDQRGVRAGLLAARLPGRAEVWPGTLATWVLDVAHNPAAAACLAQTLGDQYVSGKTYAVLGALADKDVAGMIDALVERIDHWILCGIAEGRGLSAEQLAFKVSPDIEHSLHEDVEQGLNQLADKLRGEDRVVVLGSFLTVAAARDWLNRVPAAPRSSV